MLAQNAKILPSVSCYAIRGSATNSILLRKILTATRMRHIARATPLVQSTVRKLVDEKS